MHKFQCFKTSYALVELPPRIQNAGLRKKKLAKKTLACKFCRSAALKKGNSLIAENSGVLKLLYRLTMPFVATEEILLELPSRELKSNELLVWQCSWRWV